MTTTVIHAEEKAIPDMVFLTWKMRAAAGEDVRAAAPAAMAFANAANSIEEKCKVLDDLFSDGKSGNAMIKAISGESKGVDAQWAEVALFLAIGVLKELSGNAKKVGLLKIVLNVVSRIPDEKIKSRIFKGIINSFYDDDMVELEMKATTLLEYIPLANNSEIDSILRVVTSWNSRKELVDCVAKIYAVLVGKFISCNNE